MLNRIAAPLIQELAEQFPAVLILGPRQCGKTTLAKGFLRGEYFDLEKPSDLQVFAGVVFPHCLGPRMRTAGNCSASS